MCLASISCSYGGNETEFVHNYILNILYVYTTMVKYVHRFNNNIEMNWPTLGNNNFVLLTKKSNHVPRSLYCLKLKKKKKKQRIYVTTGHMSSQFLVIIGEINCYVDCYLTAIPALETASPKYPSWCFHCNERDFTAVIYLQDHINEKQWKKTWATNHMRRCKHRLFFLGHLYIL